MRNKMSNIVAEIISAIAIIIFIAILFKVAICNNGNGHYEPTNIRQVDGSWYEWVEE